VTLTVRLYCYIKIKIQQCRIKTYVLKVKVAKRNAHIEFNRASELLHALRSRYNSANLKLNFER